MNNKNLIVWLAVLAVVAIGLFLYFDSQNKKQAQENSAPNVEEVAKQQLSFNGGEVVGTEGNKINFKTADGANLIAIVGSETQLVKQVTVKGVIKLDTATLSDFIAGKQIIVYPNYEGQSEFTPNKIQIIN